MKRKIFSVLFVLVLVLSFSLIPAMPVGANGDGATLEVSKWTEYAGNPIFDPEAKAYYPTVVKVSDSDYRMWYGSNSGVGYATSPDGINWTEQSNPISGLTSANHPLVEYYADGFSGANSGNNPSEDIMYYIIWYWDTAELYSINAIRYAESADGKTWYNDQPLQNGAVPIISGVHPEWNRGSYGPCDVLYNPGASNTGTDWVFTMYYDGTTGGDESIGIGFSSDGITWTGYDSDSDGGADPVLTGSGSGWDATYVSRCTVIKGDDQYRMWFSGGDGRMDHGIGYATSSDGLTWTKDANNPIFHKGDGVSWRDERTYCPMVIEDGGIYKVWFSGKDTATGNYAIGYATNPNPDAPYTTIQSAIDAANPNDTIIVHAGTYTEDIEIDKALTVRSTAGAEETIIDGSGFRYMVRIYSADVTFEGFTVTNPTYEGGADASGILIGAYLVEPVSNVRVLNNIVKEVRSGTSGTPSMYGATGINIGRGPLSNVVVSGNTIENIKNPEGASIDHTCGINVWDGAEGVVISNNTISDIKYNGILLQYASNVQVENNPISECKTGIRVEPFEGVTVSGLTVNLNNFADNSIQLFDGAEALVIEDVLANNTFDRAVVVEHPSASLLHTIWSSIQDGINAAVLGDTINVAAGTYEETITFTANFAINNLTIQGDVANRPVVTGGVHFGNSTPITDLSLENLYLKGDGSSGIRNHIVDMKQLQISGEVNNFTMANCVIDGENVPDRCGICGRHFSQDFTITNTEFKNVLGWALMDIHSGSGDGASSLPFATVTFANNNVHDCNGSIALRGHATTKTTTVNAYGNTFTNIGGNEGEVGQHWAALEINHAVTANVYDNTVNGVSESEWGEGQAFQFWDIDTLNVYGNDITNNYQGIFIYGGEGGGTYGGPYAIPGGSISFNNIVDNEDYGIEVGANATGGPLNATNNWWGKKGKGAINQMVSGDVNYDPWIGAKAKNSKSKKTAEDDDIVDAKDKTDTDVLKKGKGRPTITVTEYTDNPGDGAPGGFSSVGNKYIDVHIDDPEDVDEIEIRNYYTADDIAGLDEASLRLSWWNGTAWIECSDSGVNTADTDGYSGYVWAIIKATGTTPTLADLTGTAFMSMGRPPEPAPEPEPTPVGGGGGGGAPAPPAGTTDVRGMVSTAGVFYTQVTAISEDRLCRLTIPGGTVGLTEDLEPLTKVTMLIMDDPPPPPEGAHVIGLFYDFQPSGATFDPPIKLTFKYDPADIPEGIAEEDLVLAYYDEAAGEWVELEGCVVDTENNTITAPVSHLTTFAIVGAVRPPPPPAPAAFSVLDLSIQPAEVQPKEAVTITVSVANTGGTQGSYSVVLMINGVKEVEKSVTVAAGESQDVSFSVTREEAASYSVVVDGLSGSFTVVTPPTPAPVPAPAPPPAKPINWPLIGGIIAAVVAGFVIFFLIRRKAA